MTQGKRQGNDFYGARDRIETAACASMTVDTHHHRAVPTVAVVAEAAAGPSRPCEVILVAKIKIIFFLLLLPHTEKSADTRVRVRVMTTKKRREDRREWAAEFPWRRTS